MCLYELFLNFWPSFLATIFGAIIGIPIALWVSSLNDKRNKTLKGGVLLSQLLETIDHNISLSKEILDDLTNSDVSINSLDLMLLDSTSSIKYELLGDLTLCSNIDSLRHEMTVINNALEILFQYTGGVLSALTNSTSYANTFKDGIKKELENTIIPRLKMIKKEMKNQT